MAPSSFYLLRLTLSLCVLFTAVTTATCVPRSHSSPDLSAAILKRHFPIKTADNGSLYVQDPSTNQTVEQGRASDGAGYGFDAPAIIWLAWSFAVGIPLVLAGIRLSRITTGASIGLTCVLLVWASFVNTVNAEGIGDPVIAGLCMGAFGVGFTIGVLNIGRVAGITLLAIMGGMSIGVRIILFRPGLLIPSLLYANWLIITVLGIGGFVLVLLRQRAAITGGSAAVGSLLVGLGIDLIINQQDGLSMGLRFLFDRNNSHLVDLFTRQYHPPITTEIIMAVSLAAIPLFAYLQHYIFKQPFSRIRSDSLFSIRDTPRSSNSSTRGTGETATLRPEEVLEKAEKGSYASSSKGRK
ncbi:hypothetical protein EIP91_002487 [Steccherinum ochraceum]|uniref:TM7S3/TM198-like domain-containing protein n=1 Tax=Steccherinum ochraceum TaxID=92696 RepID=A0A4V2MWB1_9APHY|nr:hypothetical protein EIP91_002487 [Steccherinum ochraceum]